MRISDWSSDVCSSDLEPERALDALDFGLEMLAQLAVERAQRFVHQDKIGFKDQRAGKGDPLALPAGQRLGATVPQSRSDERRVGEECVSPCRSRWARYH